MFKPGDVVYFRDTEGEFVNMFFEGDFGPHTVHHIPNDSLIYLNDGTLCSNAGRLVQYDRPVVFSEMVAALAKPGAEILAQQTPKQAHLQHMAIGISGESGELLDAIKKHVVYQKPLDRENVVEELGDLEFYMEGLRAELGITREETIRANIKKLGKRYSSGSYSNQQAQERADKVGE